MASTSSAPAFKFLELPVELQHIICTKMTLVDYCNFLKTSKEIRRRFKKVKTILFPRKVHFVCICPKNVKVVCRYNKNTTYLRQSWNEAHKSPVILKPHRILVDTPLTDDRYKEVKKMFMEKNVRADVLHIYKDQRGCEHNVVDFVKFCRPVHLYIRKPLSMDIFKDDVIRNTTDIELHRWGCSSDILPTINCRMFYIFGDHLQGEAFRRYLKSILTTGRVVERIHIEFNQLQTWEEDRDYQSIIEDITTAIWTRESHQHSIISSIPIDYIPVVAMCHMNPLDDNVDYHYDLCFGQTLFSLEYSTDPFSIYKKHINWDAYSHLFV